MLNDDQVTAKLNMEIDLIPVGSSNRPGARITPSFITIHNTSNADAGADARMHASYLKGADARRRKVSWHFTVDDRRCIRQLPTNELGWHAGNGNSKSIGIEICEHKGMDQESALDRAALLTAVMMRALGVAQSNIVPHHFWTGKDCPHVLLRLPGGFDEFRTRASKYLDELNAGGATIASTDDVGDTSDADTNTGDETPPGEFGFAPNAAQPSGGAGSIDPDGVADLERLVGRLALENYRLRRRLDAAQNDMNEAS